MFLLIVICLFTVSFFLNCYFYYVSIKKLVEKNRVLSERNHFLNVKSKDLTQSIELERFRAGNLTKDIEFLKRELAETHNELKNLKSKK